MNMKSPRDKKIRTRDEDTKGEVELKDYAFPDLGLRVQATSEEDARAQAGRITGKKPA